METLGVSYFNLLIYTMNKYYLIYAVWLLLVVLWNFLFPDVYPIYDVIAAIILAQISNFLKKTI